MAIFSIIGTGPGAREYILPAAWEEAAGADTLLGSPRSLEHFLGLGKKALPLRGEGYREAENYIRSHRHAERIALLVSGDPGFHSYLSVIRRSFSPSEYRVIPGLSSLQLAFARIGLPWQEALLLSAHGREIPDAADRRPLFYLTDRKNGPGTIARGLMAAGMGDRTVWVLENLSYPGEKISRVAVAELAAQEKEYARCVMIVE